MNQVLSLKLLPQENLLKTGEVDHADWNYHPVLGWIQRQRFKLILSLLAKTKVHRILEIGYGSGIFMPELSHRCQELYGIDIHEKQNSVTEVLAKLNVSAKLYSGSATLLPFEPNFFDILVAVSSLEYIENLEAACLEIQRVLKPEGHLVIVTPGFSPTVDLGLKILTGRNAKNDYGDRRKLLIPTLLKYFTVVEKRTVPRFGSGLLCLYTGLKLSPRPRAVILPKNKSHNQTGME